MKAFGKKISKLVNLVGDSVDLNTLKEKQKKIDDKYQRRINKVNQQLKDLEKDNDEIRRLYEFREKYLGISEVKNEEVLSSSDDEEEEKKEDVPTTSSFTIRQRIETVFKETIDKLKVIEQDVDKKRDELTKEKEDLEKEYARVKEEVQQKLRGVRDKIQKKKDALF
jgi:hypothetical protein